MDLDEFQARMRVLYGDRDRERGLARERDTAGCPRCGATPCDCRR